MVERTFAWLGQDRWMSKDYERLPGTSEVLIYVAMTRLIGEAVGPISSKLKSYEVSNGAQKSHFCAVGTNKTYGRDLPLN